MDGFRHLPPRPKGLPRSSSHAVGHRHQPPGRVQLAALWELRRSGVTAPVLGIGGVTTAADVRDYLAVGACVAQVYTALHTDMFGTLFTLVEGVRALAEPTGESAGVVA